MILITRAQNIANVAERWRKQYPHADASSQWGRIYLELAALPAEATREQVDSIIGNSAWTDLSCHECKRDNGALVELGEEPSPESNTASICPQCLIEALALCEEVQHATH